MTVPQVMRIGIKIHRNMSGNNKPLLAFLTEVYDLDTGVMLPVARADLHFDPNNIVTATVTLDVHDVEIVEGD